MKIKAISITNSILKGVTLPSKSEIYPNNEVYAFEEKERKEEWEQAYNSALQQGIEFEDSEKASELAYGTFCNCECHKKEVTIMHFMPCCVGLEEGKIYPLVEPIECEVQDQYLSMDGKWYERDNDGNNYRESTSKTYRDVLVICEVKEERMPEVSFAKAFGEVLDEFEEVTGINLEVKEQPVKPETSADHAIAFAKWCNVDSMGITNPKEAMRGKSHKRGFFSFEELYQQFLKEIS